MQWTVITENSPMPASWQMVLVTVELVSAQKVRTLHTDIGWYMHAPKNRAQRQWKRLFRSEFADLLRHSRSYPRCCMGS